MMNQGGENSTSLNRSHLKNKQLLIAKVLVFGLILISLFTLTTSPMVWYDEVCMSSESLSFFTTGEIKLTANPHVLTGEVLHYGPLYFLSTALSFKLFGFGIFQFRIVAWICAILIAFLLAYRTNITKGNSFYLFLLLVLSDVTFLKASHNGRMETLAIVFIVAAFIVTFHSKNRSVLQYSLIGVMCALTVLVTPRSGFLLIPVAIQILALIFRKQFSFPKIIGMGVSFAIPVLIWFGYAYHFSIEEMVAEFKEIQAVGSGFAGSHFRVSSVQIHLILAIAIIIVFDGVKDKFSFIKQYWYYLTGIILFYLIVKDYGPYSVYIIWIFYVLMVNWAEGNKKKLLIPIAVLLINFGFLSLKYFTVFSTLEARNMSYVTQEMSKIIPEGSVVVGDMRYFYSVHLNGSSFRYNEEDFGTEKFEKLHREKDDYDYLVISNKRNLDYPQVLRTYQSNSILELVGTIEMKEPEGKLIEFILSKFPLTYTYSGSVYKRLKD